jgi:radical SAM superfamily enzyme
MAEALIRANLGIEFVLACRVDDIEEELFTTLKRAGLTTVFLGVEAGNQRQLDTFNKRATVEANKQAIRTLRKIGIHPALGFIMADPYSTPAELVENVRFLKEMEIKLSELESPLGELLLFDGAAILEQVRAEGRLRGDYINGYSYVAVHRGFQTLYRAAARWRSLFHTPQARR